MHFSCTASACLRKALETSLRLPEHYFFYLFHLTNLKPTGLQPEGLATFIYHLYPTQHTRVSPLSGNTTLPGKVPAMKCSQHTPEHPSPERHAALCLLCSCRGWQCRLTLLPHATCPPHSDKTSGQCQHRRLSEESEGTLSSVPSSAL